MAKVDARPDHDQMTILRDVLRIIAHTPDPQTSLEHVIALACDLTQANAGQLFVFKEPHINITVGEAEALRVEDDEACEKWIESYNDELILNPETPESVHSAFSEWVMIPLRIKQGVVGLFGIFFEELPEFDESVYHNLYGLIDGLLIVTMNARSIARHEKLGRNQREFVRIVSHDLRSPLTSIKGFASMMESGMVGELNEKQAHFTEKILSGITQISTLVDNIQDAGRYDPETGFYEMQRSPCDLSEIISKIVNNYLVPAEKQELTIIKSVADNVPIISADYNMIERAITNLVDNAIKYTPNGGNIEVSAIIENDVILLGVQDTGLGISLDNQKILFERNRRIPRKEHKRIKGTGLGLFIVRSVALHHGGNAWVESVEGEGSTFFISVPLNDENTII